MHHASRERLPAAADLRKTDRPILKPRRAETDCTCDFAASRRHTCLAVASVEESKSHVTAVNAIRRTRRGFPSFERLAATRQRWRQPRRPPAASARVKGRGCFHVWGGEGLPACSPTMTTTIAASINGCHLDLPIPIHGRLRIGLRRRRDQGAGARRLTGAPVACTTRSSF
jgi:hypothetical protein